MTIEEAYRDHIKSFTVIEIGEYKNHRYEIGFVFGPVAYIEYDGDLPTDEIENIPVHGGVTFYGRGAIDQRRSPDDFFEPGKFYFGWDYEHYGDKSTIFDVGGGKEWTREEILMDIKIAIEIIEHLKNS